MRLTCQKALKYQVHFRLKGKLQDVWPTESDLNVSVTMHNVKKINGT